MSVTRSLYFSRIRRASSISFESSLSRFLFHMPRRKIHAPPAQFNKAERTFRVRAAWRGFHILDVQEEQPVAVLFDGLGRISAALEVMRHVQFQLGEAWIHGLQDLIHFFRALAE